MEINKWCCLCEAILKIEIPNFTLLLTLAAGAKSIEKIKWEKNIDSCVSQMKRTGTFSYEFLGAVPIPATVDKPNTPADALESGINHLNIGNLTLNDVASDDRNADSCLEF